MPDHKHTLSPSHEVALAIRSQELALILVRFLAIFLIVESVIATPDLMLQDIFSNRDVISSLKHVEGLSRFLLPLMIGITLWLWGRPIARLIIGPEASQPYADPVSLTIPNLSNLAIAIAGLVLLCLDLPRFITYLVVLYESSEFVSSVTGVKRIYNDKILFALIKEGIECLIAVLLVVEAGFWTKLLLSIRSFGASHPESDPPSISSHQ